MCFMLSSLPCFPVLCCSALPTFFKGSRLKLVCPSALSLTNLISGVQFLHQLYSIFWSRWAVGFWLSGCDFLKLLASCSLTSQKWGAAQANYSNKCWSSKLLEHICGGWRETRTHVCLPIIGSSIARGATATLNLRPSVWYYTLHCVGEVQCMFIPCSATSTSLHTCSYSHVLL